MHGPADMSTNEPPRPEEPPPDALLCALALLIWTNVWRIQDLVPVLGALKLNLLATVVVAGLFLIDRDPARRLGYLRRPILICAGGLAIVAFLGIPTSLWARNSLMWWLQDVVPNLFLMVMLAAGIRGTRDLEWIGLVIVIGASVYSLFAVLLFGLDASGRLGDMAYYDANDLALVLLCTMPFALHLLVRGGRWRRVLALGSLAAMGAAFVSSGSRGGFVALVAMLGFFLVAYRAIALRFRVLTVVVGFGAFALVAGEGYLTKIRALTDIQQDYNWSGRAAVGRMEVWRRGVGYTADNPLLGVGLRSFPIAEGKLSEEARARAERGRGFKWSAAHNSFLEVAAELGIPGLLFFLGMLGATFLTLGRVRRGAESGYAPTFREVAIACSLSTSLVGYCVAGAFVSAEHFSMLYVLVGLAIALTKLCDLAWLDALEWADWAPRPHSDPSPRPGMAGRARQRRELVWR